MLSEVIKYLGERGDFVSHMMSFVNIYFSDELCKDCHIPFLERTSGRLFSTEKRQSAEKSFWDQNARGVNPPAVGGESCRERTMCWLGLNRSLVLVLRLLHIVDEQS